MNSLFAELENRFKKNKHFHPDILWENVLRNLQKNDSLLGSLDYMEQTGGEPDVVGYDEKNNQYIFFDCSLESPIGRRSLCYDNEALAARKENKPKGSALGMAQTMGIVLLTEEQYRYLQTLGDFDTKTSSWLLTPSPIRKLCGAIFGDKRYNSVFIYHNGAESYYAARGFRGCLRV